MATDMAIQPEWRQVKGFAIAGTASGVGKTTVTLSVMAALRKRGLTVQPWVKTSLAPGSRVVNDYLKEVEELRGELDLG